MTTKFKECGRCLYQEETTWSYENAICQKCKKTAVSITPTEYKSLDDCPVCDPGLYKEV